MIASPRRRTIDAIPRTVPAFRPLLTALALVLLAAAWTGTAAGSIKVAGDARGAKLRVGADGTAEVRWTTPSGERRSLLVPRSGSVRYGGALAGGDVSRPAAADIPHAVVVRRGPDGAFYALQAWRRLRTGPVELRFARWRGEPTLLTLEAVCCRWGGESIEGRASFQGRAIFGHRSTPRGVPLDPDGRNVYLDTFRANRWERMMGILTHRNTGFFRLWIRPNWQGTLYRGSIIGPNWGWSLGPDAYAETPSVKTQ